MAAQELQAGRRAGARTALEEDRDRQEEIFREREAELLARHPGKFIAVCGGDVFVGKEASEAISGARAAHPGRLHFMRMHDPFHPC